MVTIIEETNHIAPQSTPIASLDDVQAYVSADARRAYSVGIQECDTGDYESALDHFDQALEIDKNFPHAWYNKGTVLGQMGRYPEAVEALDHALSLMPDYIDAGYNKGVALARAGMAQEALEVFERILGQNPRHTDSWLGKSIVLLDQGSTKAALAILQEALAYVGDEPMIWSTTGVAHSRLGEFSEAQRAFEKDFELNNGSSSLDLISYKAWASSIIALGISAFIAQNFSEFESAGLAYIDVLEKAEEEGAGPVVEDSLTQVKLMLRNQKGKGRPALAALEELEVFIKLMKIKDPLEGWRALGKVISESWPKGLSAVQAIREQRR